ncbi:MAG TPA: hypothetical protein VL404_09720 [Candidatus Eisenbacteria bacterium]|nr:hypothetical protein [Candidatus Eisenbacteria bacterium]
MKNRSALVVFACLMTVIAAQSDAHAGFFGKKDKKADPYKSESSSSSSSRSAATYDYPSYTPAASSSTASTSSAPAASYSQPAAPAPAAPAVKGFSVAEYDPKLPGDLVRDRTSQLNRLVQADREQLGYVLNQKGVDKREIDRQLAEYDSNRYEHMKQTYDKLYKKQR